MPTRTPKKPKYRAINPRPMALQFDHVANEPFAVTRATWTPEATGLLDQLRQSLQAANRDERLPIRALRFLLQVADGGVLRVEGNLGLFQTKTLLSSTSDHATAHRQANQAVAIWVQQELADSRLAAYLDKTAVRQLRQLALAGRAVRVTTETVRVFDWPTHEPSGTAKPYTGTQFMDLADFLADKLAGTTVFAEAGPLRRIVGANLTTGTANLLTPPLTRHDGRTLVRFSLGITLQVATYPGRALPVIIVRHQKHVWAREPKRARTNGGGLAFPQGEDRAFQFGVGRKLEVFDDYAALARQYSLPLTEQTAEARQPVSGRTLAGRGDTAEFGQCPVYITALPTHQDAKLAQRGVPDFDRLLSFEKIAEVLAPYGVRPWQDALLEIPTLYNPGGESGHGWKHAFEAPKRTAQDDDKSYARKLKKAAQEQDKWVQEKTAVLDTRYEGHYYLVLAVQSGLGDDAAEVCNILQHTGLLGGSLTVHQLVLPAGAHLPKGPNEPYRAEERADSRQQAWEPFLAELAQLQQQHRLDGVLVLAREWYPQAVGKPKHDDTINKRVGRILLQQRLGLGTQYLLPRETNKAGQLKEGKETSFRTRVLNAWLDLALKSRGVMHGLSDKVLNSISPAFATQAPAVVLGFGIIRRNQQQQLQNETCFMPYAVELNLRTGVCRASLLLRNKDQEPSATEMLPLPAVLRALVDNGPSHVARGLVPRDIQKEQARLTQHFLLQTLLNNVKEHPNPLVLLDRDTLSGFWPWLADVALNPEGIQLNDVPHVQALCPQAAFVRLRNHHAPKVVLDAPQIKVEVDGVWRPAPLWSEAHLFRLRDASETVPTYYSFGWRISKQKRGCSSYRTITGEKGPIKEMLKAWASPNGTEITVVRTGGLPPDDIAKLVEALRSEYGHYGNWTTAPAPLHFASVLKQYVPDYEWADENETGE